MSRHLDRDSLTGYRLVLYSCYSIHGLAGLAFLIRKSPTLGAALDIGWYQVWAGLLIGGGIAGLVGLTMKTVVSHYVEAVALIALFGALLVFVLALAFADSLRDTSGPNVGLMLLLLGSMMAMVSRALVLRNQIRIREREGWVILHEPE